jgi:aromatic-L-amino-acid decarboxylase
MDWVAKLFGLDDSFFNTSNVGGGIIMGSASESVLTIAVAAREKAVRILSTPTVDRTQLTSKFVILGTDQTHSLGAKTGLILGIPFRALKTQKIDNWSLRGSTLKAALEEERDGGRIPSMLIATLGSTSTGAIDNIAEITAVG